MKAFLERQQLSAKSEVLDCVNEDAKDFLQDALTTGHRYYIIKEIVSPGCYAPPPSLVA